MSESPEGTLWDLMRGALTARAIGVVADLRIADALAEGPRPVTRLAADSGADPETLHRFLRALASDGVFAEEERGVFRNTPASELLRGGWGAFAHLFGGIFYRTAGALEADGRPSFPELFGAEFWTWLAANPDERAVFDTAMEQGNDRRVEQLASLEWRGDETIVDVGGGNGSLLRGLLDRRQGLRGIVFDLPETVRDEAAFGDRCAFAAGSFFERVPRGDVYVLSTILHDWDDEHATRILRTIGASAERGTRLIILDAVVPPGNEAGGGKWLDLLMLAISGGRERDEAQWRDLLARGGFEPVRFADALIEARCL
jgi:hypothetical protein